MLKQRLLTAVILIPLIVWIFTLSSQILACFMGIFVVLGAWEWAGICGWHSFILRAVYAMVVTLGLLMLYLLGNWNLGIGNGELIITILLLALLWWLVALYWILRYQQGNSLIPTSPLIKALLGLLILLPAWLALLVLHGDEFEGRQWVLFLLVLIWTADSGAYFAGKQWGKIKLASRISPGKTWEGVVGALLFSSVVSLAFALFNSMPLITLLIFMLLCLLTIMVSILGDLLESLFKRSMGIKDSGQLLPGHGGVLDRIDSLTSAAPFFVVGLITLGKIF